jgi:hypothetical protein
MSLFGGSRVDIPPKILRFAADVSGVPPPHGSRGFSCPAIALAKAQTHGWIEREFASPTCPAIALAEAPAVAKADSDASNVQMLA